MPTKREIELQERDRNKRIEAKLDAIMDHLGLSGDDYEGEDSERDKKAN